MSTITTTILISVVSNLFETNNAIVIAEIIEQKFQREVNIDFIAYYLEKERKNDEEKSSYNYRLR